MTMTTTAYPTSFHVEPFANSARRVELWCRCEGGAAVVLVLSREVFDALRKEHRRADAAWTAARAIHESEESRRLAEITEDEA